MPQNDLPALVANADVVIHARLTAAQAHLSPDERWVLTTFALTPIQVLLDRAAAASRTPALPTSYKATFLGGEVMIDGISASSANQTLPLPLIGDEVILFLTQSAELKSWVAVAGPGSVFKITTDGTIQSPRKSLSHNGKQRETFLNEVVAEIARAKPR